MDDFYNGFNELPNKLKDTLRHTSGKSDKELSTECSVSKLFDVFLESEGITTDSDKLLNTIERLWGVKLKS